LSRRSFLESGISLFPASHSIGKMVVVFRDQGIFSLKKGDGEEYEEPQ
jgi:hypothetical protein